MNSIYDLRYYTKLGSVKQPDIYVSNWGSELIWEWWNMTLKYGSENRIIQPKIKNALFAQNTLYSVSKSTTIRKTESYGFLIGFVNGKVTILQYKLKLNGQKEKNKELKRALGSIESNSVRMEENFYE